MCHPGPNWSLHISGATVSIDRRRSGPVVAPSLFDQARVLVLEARCFKLQRLGFNRVRVGGLELTLDIAPHGQDDLAFTLVWHLSPSEDVTDVPRS